MACEDHTCKSGCNFVNEKRLVLYLNLLYHGMKKYIPSWSTNILGVNSAHRRGEAWASIIDPNNAKIVHHESVAYVV